MAALVYKRRSVAIGRLHRNDPYYRYRMPAMNVSKRGRTTITNMRELAKSLRCDPIHATKFLGFELGTHVKYVEDSGASLLNGQYEQEDLEALLDKFVDMFVLCSTCNLPEQSISVDSKCIHTDCAACGHSGTILPSVHKLASFIVRRHASTAPASKSARKKQKNQPPAAAASAAAMPRASQDHLQHHLLSPYDPVAAFSSDEKSRLASFEEVEGALFEQPMEEVEGACLEWLADHVAASVAASPAAAADCKDDDDVVADPAGLSSGPLPAEVVLQEFLASQPRQISEILDELRLLGFSRGLDEMQQVQLLLRVIMTETKPKAFLAQLKFRAALLAKLSPLAVISCLEEVLGVQHKELLKLAPRAFKLLYDSDVLDEASILSWHDAKPESSVLVPRAVAVEIRKLMDPLVEWLRTAEEAESEEEEAE